jgi:hypothetical protein
MDPTTAQKFDQRIPYFLTALLVINLVYPISAYGVGWALFYQVLISATFTMGVFLIGDNRKLFLIALFFALLGMVAGVFYNIKYLGELREIHDSANLAYTVVLFGSFILLQAILLFSLLRYIFQSQHVTREVIFTSISVYLLFSSFFVPIYRLIEVFSPGAFILSYSPEAVVEWQNLMYYSFATLTTLGYGDIVPVNLWAKAVASLESVLGVMYLAILVARLVSMYKQKE